MTDIAPAWLVLLATASAAGVSVLTLLTMLRKRVDGYLIELVEKVVMPLLARIDKLAEVAAVVETSHNGWDGAADGLTRLSDAVESTNSRLDAVQADVTTIREQTDENSEALRDIHHQVHINGGTTLKDRLLAQSERGDERHAALDAHLEQLNSRLDRIADDASTHHDEQSRSSHRHVAGDGGGDVA